LIAGQSLHQTFAAVGEAINCQHEIGMAGKLSVTDNDGG
jgi:hypothetical protein